MNFSNSLKAVVKLVKPRFQLLSVYFFLFIIL